MRGEGSCLSREGLVVTRSVKGAAAAVKMQGAGSALLAERIELGLKVGKGIRRR